MPPVRFVPSRGCVEAVEEDRPGRHHHDQCAGRTTTIVNVVLTVASEVIRRTTVRVNVAADAGSLSSELSLLGPVWAPGLFPDQR